MQLKSKIQYIEPNGTYQNGSGSFNKFRVSFANGDTLGFLSKGDFKGKVGDEITYEKNEQYNTGKIVYEKPAFTPKPQGNYAGKSDDVQKYIIRQSSAASAANFYSRVAGDIDTQEIITLAREIENFVYNG